MEIWKRLTNIGKLVAKDLSIAVSPDDDYSNVVRGIVGWLCSMNMATERKEKLFADRMEISS